MAITDGIFGLTDDAPTVVGPDGISGHVTGIDASSLFDGSVTYIATESDALGEYYEIDIDADKSTGVAPTVVMTAPAAGAAIKNNVADARPQPRTAAAAALTACSSSSVAMAATPGMMAGMTSRLQLHVHNGACRRVLPGTSHRDRQRR